MFGIAEDEGTFTGTRQHHDGDYRNRDDQGDDIHDVGDVVSVGGALDHCVHGEERRNDDGGAHRSQTQTRGRK